jgi:leucyl aminopeptidase (aminopeptidase T)
MGFGGNVDVPVHVDGVIREPTIYFDRKKIMDSGKLSGFQNI